MNLQSQYLIYAGTVRGALLYTQSKLEDPVRYELCKVEKSEITSMEWGRTEDEIVVGHRNGCVKLYSTIKNKYRKTLDNLEGKGPVVGIGIQEQNIIVGRQNGYINVWSKMDSSNSFSINLQDESALDCMVTNKSRNNVIGTGGERNDFKMWDLEMKKPIFKAKSMGHDELNLPIPTSIRGICFLSNDNNLAACATKEGYTLLYDDRAQRKPVTIFIEPKASYSAIAACYRERQCVVGTTKGYIQLLDLRSPSKCVRTYKSFTGGVTSLVCDSVSPIVVSTSLDRHIRIHNLETKECLYKKYLKQSLTKLVMKPVVKEEPEEKTTETEVDEEYESLFENMKTVEEEPKKRKKNKDGNIKFSKKKN